MWFIKIFSFFQKLLCSPGFEPGLLRPQRNVLTTRRSGPIVLQGNRFHIFSRFRCFWRFGTLSRQTFVAFCLANLISVYFSSAKISRFFSVFLNHIWNRLPWSIIVPDRLVVRTLRCGRNNPGSNPGLDSRFWKKLKKFMNHMPKTIKRNNSCSSKKNSFFRKIMLCRN